MTQAVNKSNYNYISATTSRGIWKYINFKMFLHVVGQSTNQRPRCMRSLNILTPDGVVRVQISVDFKTTLSVNVEELVTALYNTKI